MSKMNRIFYGMGVMVLLVFAVLQIRERQVLQEVPIFLKTDEIANAHKTKIGIHLQSKYKPDSSQLDVLKSDYSNIWAHLNYVYETNDITAGKEYYTEALMKQMSTNYEGKLKSSFIKRQDIKHNLYIQNWSTDGLVCTAIDSNVELKFVYNNSLVKVIQVNLALVLLYQGDHWRIDALRVLDESVILSYRNNTSKNSLFEKIFGME
jgi:hypothetical protein